MDYALNRDRMRLKELSPIASFLLLVVVPIFALAAPREKCAAPSVRPLAVAAEKDFDLVPIDKDGIFQRRLDNIDVLVVTSDTAKKDEALAAAIKAFAARGGKVVGFGKGRAALPEGGIASESRGGVVRTISELFKQPSHQTGN